MFVHSAPVPRFYKAAAKGLAIHATGGSFKEFLHTQKLHPNISGLYALIGETVKHESQLDDFFSRINFFDLEPRFNPHLAKILFTELIWREKELGGKSKPILTALDYFKKHTDACLSLRNSTRSDDRAESAEVFKPRYVRINALRMSAADAVRNFQNEGWNLIRCTSGTYDDYLKQLQNLEENDFIPDYHVKVVFAFHPKASLKNCTAYIEGDMFLQDKATALAGHLLAPTPGSTVLDMCAAPGMKTTHLAAILKNQGTIYSVEQDKKRFEILSQFIEASGATCVKLFNKDVLTLNKGTCPNVDYILLDPSCSGSGINRLGGNDKNFDIESGRLQKLSSFQAKLLRFALNEFSSAKRVVYSTCSLYPQENEEVIRDVVENHKGRFRLVSAKERLNNKWNNVGDPKYRGIGEKCIYARPDSDFTCGFFIAVFEKMDDNDNDVKFDNEIDEKSSMMVTENEPSEIDYERSVDLNENINSHDDVPSKKQKKRKYDASEENVTSDGSLKKIKNNRKDQEDDSEMNVPKKKSKKTKRDIAETETEVIEVEENNELNSSDSLPKKKKKKHKKDKTDVEIIENETNSNIDDCIEISTSKKKKKKKKKIEDNVQDVTTRKRSHKESVGDEVKIVDYSFSSKEISIKGEKRKKKIANGENDVEVVKSGNSSNKKSKRKNKKKPDEEDNIEISDDDEVPKRKIKTFIVDIDITNDDDDGSISRKKTKGSFTHSQEFTDVDDEDSVKKKKRRVNSESVEIIEGEVSNAENCTPRKKKKKML